MTAAYLRELGVEIDIHLSCDEIDYNQYDLLHFFNIIRPADIVYHISKSHKPFVVSTIFVDYSEVEKRTTHGIRGLLVKIFTGNQMEYLKAIARWMKNGEIVRTKRYLVWGHKRSIRYVAKKAAMLLPNSENEYRRFVKRYNVQQKYHVIPNGIDEKALLKIPAKDPKYENAVICMARIEGLKNQLNLIKALNNTGYRVFLHGKPSPNNLDYFNACKSIAADNIIIGSWLEGDALYAAYASAKVQAMPIYFETTGLSSLEAAVMGCNIVVSDRGDTKDYFKDDAWYCNPDDIASIKKAVDAAYNAPYNEAFRERILKEFTWKRAAEETLKAYKQVLKF